MNPRTVRFRCPRCQACHSVAASRSGSSFVCRTCFAALRVPEGLPHGIAPATLDEVAAPASAGPEALKRAASATVRGPLEVSVGDEVDDVAQPARPGLLWGLVAAAATLGLMAVAVLGLKVVGLRDRGRDRVADGPVEVAQANQATIPGPATPTPARSGRESAAAGSTPPKPAEDETPAVPADPATHEEAAPAPAAEVATTPGRPATTLETTEPAPPRPPTAEPRARRKGEIVRRQTRDEEALRRELLEIPELGLRPATAEAVLRFTRTEMTQDNNPAAVGIGSRGADRGPAPRHDSAATFDLVRGRQSELGDLAWRLGDECRLGKEPAQDLQDLSRALRNLLQQAIAVGRTGPDPDTLRRSLIAEAEASGVSPPARRAFVARGRAGLIVTVNPEDWRRPEAIPALMQLLMAEATTVREVLVDVLAKIPGEAAATALARLAIFDLAREVRERAIRALAERPVEQARPTLLAGLRYPWAPVADHAAEALVTLDDRGAIPDLEDLLDQPDPLAPAARTRHGSTRTVAPRLVRLSHLRNCLLCHAPSQDPTTDLVRGKVPIPGMPLPPPQRYYGDAEPGYYVRAEITYLRQDFSVAQPVDGAEPWPSHQRFDYLIADVPTDRLPPATKDKAGRPASYPQRESVLFALRNLRGDEQDGPRSPSDK